MARRAYVFADEDLPDPPAADPLPDGTVGGIARAEASFWKAQVPRGGGGAFTRAMAEEMAGERRYITDEPRKNRSGSSDVTGPLKAIYGEYVQGDLEKTQSIANLFARAEAQRPPSVGKAFRGGRAEMLGEPGVIVRYDAAPPQWKAIFPGDEPPSILSVVDEARALSDADVKRILALPKENRVRAFLKKITSALP